MLDESLMTGFLCGKAKLCGWGGLIIVSEGKWENSQDKYTKILVYIKFYNLV